MAAAGSTAGGGGIEPRFIVPFPHNAGFVGRGDDLARIHELLQKGEAVGVRPVAAAGMGGIGKTQLAVQYAYRHRDDYPGGVYWVNAAQDVQAEMAELARQVGLFEDGAPDAERQQRRLEALVRFLDTQPEALVIFDNVEDPRSLRSKAFGFVPAQLRCRVLFTTRVREAGFATVAVGALPAQEGLELLAIGAGRTWKGSEREAAAEVCRLLGYLPLALALAGAYLGQNRDVAPEDYRERLLEEGALAVDATEVRAEDLATRHDAAVGRTLALQWALLAKLPGGGAAERKVLHAVALLGEAAEVPRARLALLTGLAVTAGKKGYPSPLGTALRRLADLFLVEALEGERAIRLHPLVREFAEGSIEGRAEFAAECAGNLGEVLWEMGRLSDEVAARGVDAVLGDLRVGVRLSREGEAGWIERLVRVLDREAHWLRRWQPAERPELLLQQVRNRCFEMREEDGRGLAEGALAKQGFEYLRERVRSGRGSEALVRTPGGHTDGVTGVAVMADGFRAVSASWDMTLKVWDVGSEQLVRTLERHALEMNGVPDGRQAVSASWDKTRRRWDLGNGQLVRTLEGHGLEVNGVSLMADGRWVVSASSNKTRNARDLGNGQLVRTIEGHTQAVYGVAVTADGRWAVSASGDDTLKVWNLGSGQLVRTLKGHTHGVYGVAVTADGRAVSASGDDTLKVWDLGSGQLVRTLEGHTGAVHGVAVTADGLWAVSASGDDTLKVWDLGSGQLVRTLEGHTDAVHGVAVTANARWVVSASEDETLKVWDLGSGQLVRTLEGHTDAVYGVAVTANARWVVSASKSKDETLRVWDLTSGLTVAMLETPAPLHCCAVASDRLFLAGDTAGAVHILDWLPLGHPTPLPAPAPVLRPPLPPRASTKMPSATTYPPKTSPPSHTAAIATGLAAARTSLFGGIPPAFVDSLPTSPSPTTQLLSDLHTLNTLEALADGAVPLRTWLTNALALTSIRRESAVFQHALDRLTPPAPGAPVINPAPPQPPKLRWGAKLTGPELKVLAEALLSAFPTREALAQLLRFELDKRLDDIAAGTNLRATVFELLTTAEAEGWVLQLFEAALLQVPGNPELRAIADQRRV